MSTVQRPGDSIRLLELYPPDEGQNPVQARLFWVRLSDEPRYEALSYVWEAQPINERGLGGFIEIELSREKSEWSRREITPNLQVALIHLRPRKTSRILWIDALCIAQTDVDDRNRQVALMGRIYSQAIQVIVWLGEGKSGADNALDVLSTTLLLAKSNRLSNQFTDTEVVTALDSILASPYWHRMWTVQEFVLAKQIVLTYGKSRLIWTMQHSTAMSDLHNQYSSNTARPASLREMLRLSSYWSERRQGGTRVTIPLFSLVEDFSTRGCSDPRDRVFALLALASREDVESNWPDYFLSFPFVILRLLCSYIGVPRKQLEMASSIQDATNDPDASSTKVRVSCVLQTLLDSVRQGELDQGQIGTTDITLFNDRSLNVSRSRLGVNCESCELVVKGVELDTIARLLINDHFNDPRLDRGPTKHNNLLVDANAYGGRATVETWFSDYHGRCRICFDEANNAQVRARLQEFLYKQSNPYDDRWKSLENRYAAPHDRLGACTESGHYVNVPDRTKPGDIIIFIHGINAMFIAHKPAYPILKIDTVRSRPGYHVYGDCFAYCSLASRILKDGQLPPNHEECELEIALVRDKSHGSSATS